MIFNADLNPPPNPSAQTIESVFALLAAVSDPASIKKRLDDLIAQHAAVKQAQDELEVSRAGLVAENAKATDLASRESALAVKQYELQNVSLAQQVATAAIADREAKCAAAEAALKARVEAVEQREREHTRRVEQAKAALG